MRERKKEREGVEEGNRVKRRKENNAKDRTRWGSLRARSFARLREIDAPQSSLFSRAGVLDKKPSASPPHRSAAASQDPAARSPGSLRGKIRSVEPVE